MKKLETMDQVIELIKDGDSVVTSGIAMSGVPDEILHGLAEYYEKNKKPQNLTFIHAAGQGDWDEKHAYQQIAYAGLIKRVIAGHYDSSDKIGTLIEENKIEGYNFPQGVITNLYRQAAKGRKFYLSKIGLKTFVDPRVEGGKLNPKTTEDLVKVVNVEGEEFLCYKIPQINVALIRATSADSLGNLSLNEEALPVDMLDIAMATHAQGGKVIAQVKYTCDRLMTEDVDIAGSFVDYVYVSQEPTIYHLQTGKTFFKPEYAGRVFVPTIADNSRMPLNAKKVMARRAAMELVPGSIINLGVGSPEFVAKVVSEEDCVDEITMTSESGAFAGIPQGGKDFGAVVNAWAIVRMLDQFDFYEGNGLTATFLGNAETDQYGNVNTSHFGTKVTGCGGFPDISQCTKNLIFMGTFTAGGLKEKFEDGKLVIVQEGKKQKYIPKVQQITFSAEFGVESGQNVLYITERCVFKAVEGGLKLIEIAPGIDLQKDILDQMGFKPIIEDDLKLMDERLFREENFGLKEMILAKGK